MSKQSPAVARTIAVLNFFLEHPGHAFNLTQVVKSLRLSRATTHSILLAFVETGYLYRRHDKSYVLGPILPSLAASAIGHISPLAVASQEMRAIADEFDVIASALFLDGDEMLVRERAASVNNLGLAKSVSGRGHSIYPFGSVFLMALSAADLEARLDRVVPALTDTMRDDVRAGIAFARTNGFIVSTFSEDDPVDVERVESGRLSTDDLAPEALYRIRFLIAPVIGDGGEAVFAISMFGFQALASGTEVSNIGRRLRETCQRISLFIRGKRLPPVF